MRAASEDARWTSLCQKDFQVQVQVQLGLTSWDVDSACVAWRFRQIDVTGSTCLDRELIVDVGPELLDLLRRLKRDTPTSLDDLVQQAHEAKSTIHLRLKRLVELDLVVHVPRVGYSLNDRGEAMTAERPPIPDAWPRLPLPDQLRVLPPVHLAIIELALAAAAGRYHRVFTESLASFLLHGKGLKLKTLVMRIVCLLAGGDVKRHVLRLFKETAASATVRRNSAGVARVRSVASAPIVGLDELTRARPEVRDACLVYVFGETEFPESDDTVLEILATPIIALNPPEGLDTSDPTVDLQQVTGYDGAMRRRMVIADLSKVEIPEALRGKGGRDLLEALMEAGPYKLPRPVFPDFLPDEVVRGALLAIFDRPERLDEADVLMVAQLIAGATAFRLDKAAAVRNVLRNVATCYATRGWLRTDWQQALTEQLAGRSPPSNPVKAATVTTPAPTDADVAAFTRWCVRRGRRAFPSTPKAIVAYVNELEREKYAVATIERTLAAITVAHNAIGEESPCDARSVRRRLDELRGRATKASPLLAADLTELVENVPDTLRWKRNLALILLGVSAALRPEELVSVRIEGLRFAPNGLVVAFLSITGEVQTLFVPKIDSALCAVTAVAEWIAESGIENGYIFVHLHDGYDIGDTERHIPPRMVDRIVRDAVERLGKDTTLFDGRSLREGHVAARRAQLEEGLLDLDALRAGG